MSDESFLTLIRRVRAGDEDAAAELVARYGDHIRRIARVRLQGNAVRRLVESSDICQSVMANFFQQLSEGQYELDTPEQLLSLLATMARNQVLKKIAFHQAHRRDLRRLVEADRADAQFAASDDSPSAVLAGEELMENFRERLSDDEKRLFDDRVAGRSWNEIAIEMNVPPDRIRKRLTRAVQRAAVVLGISVGADHARD